MRVENRVSPQATGNVTGPRPAEAGQRFALSAAPTAQMAGAGAAPAAASLAGLDAVLTLQADSDTPQERRRRSAQRGHDLLDGLDRLKAALLMGRVSTHDLTAIAGRLAERAGSSGDPRLDALVADIELRAAVEVAKLEARRGA